MNRLILSLLAGLTLFSSCSSNSDDVDNPNPPGPEPTLRDTLAAHAWKMNQITYSQNTVFGYWERGVAGGGAFNNDKIKFDTSGTGVYTNTYGENFDFVWQFRNAKRQDIDLVIKNIQGGRPAAGKDLPMLVNNVVVTDDQLRYTEIFIEGATPTITSVVRTDDGNFDDTPFVPAVALADRMAEHPWLMEELIYLENNSINYYKRGVSGGGSFLNDFIKFEKNGTGIYNNTYNEQFALTWEFKNGNKQDVNMIIKDIQLGRPHPGTNLEMKLENMTVVGGVIRYTELFTSGGQTSMTSVTRKAN
jgi:hypothetical protein